MKKEKTIDTNIIDGAIRLATKAHEGVVRKGGSIPYIVHPMEAMVIVSTITDDQEVMAAAVLHDVVEDSDITIEDIRRDLGPRVADLVYAETDSEVPGLSHIESWQHRKQTTIDRLSAASRDVQIVALGDKLSNIRAILRDYHRLGDSLWQRFNEKNVTRHAWYYHQLVKSLDSLSDTDAYQEFANLVEQVFPTNEIK